MTQNYDIIIIGGGSGGLAAAAGAAKLGAKVALIEKNKLGGECLWTGCVPSKALIHAATVASTIKKAKTAGIEVPSAKIHFSNIMDYVQNIIKKIQPHDSPERFRSMGVDVIFSNPQFETKHTIIVNDQKLYSKKFIIATGSRPFKLPIKGLEETGYLTNETIFENKKFPKTLLILGGGPIGVEMAQAFARLGSKVIVFERGENILSKEDTTISKKIESILTKEGITILKNTEILKVEKKTGKKIITYKQNNNTTTINGDEILAAVGRTPNIEGLNLESINVEYDKRSIKVNKHLQTTVKNIYAIGDVNGKYLFTHAAAYEAGIALTNALFHLPIKTDYTAMPWTTFTQPEIARVGMTEEEAKQKHSDALVFETGFETNDRAQTDDATQGFIKTITTKKGNILGVHIIGEHAGELIAEFVLAMRKNLKIQDIYKTVHVYPTLSGINAKIAGTFYEKKLTPTMKKILKFIFRYG